MRFFFIYRYKTNLIQPIFFIRNIITETNEVSKAIFI